MKITPYHAKHYAHDLTRRAANGMDRLSMALFDAAVDLNPHQIEAALFALQSPLSKGVILADEVGLGKTIEAGIVLCQFWAERKRRLLVICPASLRKQWALELQEKFNLPTQVLDAKVYGQLQRCGRTPLNEKAVLIVSLNYANALREEIKGIAWDLVVIDEAHKLRNAYRPSNKVGQGIRWATEDCRKLLLTATPLQNSLLELYGLSTLIDEHIFGDLNSFRSQYASAGSSLNELRQRLVIAIGHAHAELAAQASRAVNASLTLRNWLIGFHIEESFTHIAELLQCDDATKRAFYELECVRGHWSVRELKRQIASLYYERSGLSKDKATLAAMVKERAEVETPALTIRDPYVFEFLGLKPQEVMGESHLEDQLLDKLHDFLLELGHGFCFEARQKRILIGDTHHFVDLVFYHRLLKCHVLVELKVAAFSHENIGQLNTYVSWYRKHMMTDGDNPPVGILLCTQKDHALVEYALAGLDNELFVSKYLLELPKQEDMQRFIEEHLAAGEA